MPKPRRASANFTKELRRQALKRLAERGDVHLLRSTEDKDLQAYQEELYRAELEVQNEELRRTQMEYQSALERYRDLYDHAPVGYLTLDAEGKILQANEAAACLCRRTAKALCGFSLERIVMREDREKLARLLRSALSTGRVQASDFRLLRPSAQAHWVHADLVALTGTQGGGHAFRLTLTDIHERRQHEQQLAKQARLLHLSYDAIIVHDDLERITYWNTGAQELYGYEQKNALGKRIHELLRTEFPEPWREIRARLLSEGRWEGELIRSRKDGARIAVLTRWALDLNEADSPPSVLESSNDITKRREFQTKLEQLITERTAKLKELGLRFISAEMSERHRVAKVLHDGLQQVLVGAAYSLAALSGPRQQAPTKNQLSDIADLVNEAVGMSRSLTAELCPTVLHQDYLAPAMRWLAEWHKEKHGLTVQVQAVEDLRVPREEVRVALFEAAREVLFNITKHAGVKRATLHLAKAPGGAVRITVRDKGVGFDPAQMRGRDSSVGGFGLVEHCQRLELLGGKIEIQSTPGQGTTVTIFGPLPAPPTEFHQPKSGVVPALPPTDLRLAPLPGGPIRILLVDDHAVVRDGLALAFRDEPDLLVVGQAADGHQAVELARQLRPDVILMDQSMPHMDGATATRQITTEMPGIIVIGLSMHDDEAHRKLICEAGAVDFVDKKGPLSRIIECVRQHAEGKRNSRRHKHS